jgi:formate dehydrogenase subunit gamma
MSTSTTSVADLARSAVAEHRHERGPLLVILHEIQERLGYVDPAVIPILAEELNLSRAEVHGVVSFYRDLRSEPPAHVTLRLCRAEACKAVGAEALLASVEDALGIRVGETTADGATSLDQVFCLGNCALGPSGQVNGRVHGRLDTERALALVRGSRP